MLQTTQHRAAKIVGLCRNENNNPANANLIMRPGEPVAIAAQVVMEIAYDLAGKPRLKCWYQGSRIKDYFFDKNNQVDLSQSIDRCITLLFNRNNKETGHPIETCVILETANWMRQSSNLLEGFFKRVN